MHRIRGFFVLFGLALLASCSDANNLAEPTATNVVDTFTLGALEGTPIATPSGYSATAGGPVRTDRTLDFEFAYNVRRLENGDSQPVFLPRAALGFSSTTADPGLQRREEEFDEITRARSNGYVTDSAVPIQVGERYLMRSRVVCSGLGVPLYAKLLILGIEDRSVTFQLLLDGNCGYKGLEPGLPDD
jgi:hypothetical protein